MNISTDDKSLFLLPIMLFAFSKPKTRLCLEVLQETGEIEICERPKKSRDSDPQEG